MADQRVRTPEERKALVERAWQMAVDGKSQATIASELGVSQGQVSRMLARAGRVAKARMNDQLVSYLLVALDQIDLLWREAMKGHVRSMRPSKRTVRKGDVVTVHVVYRDGDPAWIHEALQVMKLSGELIGRILPRPEAAKDKDGPSAAERSKALEIALGEAERRDSVYRARDLSESPRPIDRPSPEPD